MSDPKNPKDRADKQSDQPTAVGTQGGDRRSGRVTHDSRGNPVWEWQLETGVYSRDVSTHRLKKLDLGDLSIAETAKHKRPEGLGKEDQKSAMPGGGFNPYDNSPPVGGNRGFNPYDNARALGAKMKPSQSTPAPARKPTDLKKLEEWMAAKKRAEENKDK